MFRHEASATELKRKGRKRVAGEKRVRQSDKLIILIVRQDAFRLRDGPRGVFVGLKGREGNVPLFDGEQENLITAMRNLPAHSLLHYHRPKPRVLLGLRMYYNQ
jgi:hypothetical protein